MPQKRDERKDLARYVKMVKTYLDEEKKSIVVFEKLCALRGVLIDERVRLVMDFFRKEQCLSFPKLLFYLYEVRALFWEFYDSVTVDYVFDVTLLRLWVYYWIIKKNVGLGGRGYF